MNSVCTWLLCSYDVQKVCDYAFLLPRKHADLLTWPVIRLFIWGIWCGYETDFAKHLRCLDANFGNQPPDFSWKAGRLGCVKGESLRAFCWDQPRREQSTACCLTGVPRGFQGIWQGNGMAEVGHSAAGARLGAALGAGSRELPGLEELLQERCCEGWAGFVWCHCFGKGFGVPCMGKGGPRLCQGHTNINILKLYCFNLYFSISIFSIIYKYTELVLQSTLKHKRSQARLAWHGHGRC